MTRPLADVLDGDADLGQPRWLRWRGRSNSDHLPEQFASVLDVVINFADPVLAGTVSGKAWNPVSGEWE